MHPPDFPMEGASPGPPRQVSWVQDCPVLSLGGRPDSDHPRCAPNRSAPKGDAGTECEEKHKCGASGLAFSGRLSEPGFPEVVLTKMMGKAFKYTPRGGRVLARLEGRGRSATVSVSDTDIGIAADDLPRLGEEFFRASNAKASGITGTGLGLTIVRQHLDHWGARMAVESEIGRGSTFRIVLPIDA